MNFQSIASDFGLLFERRSTNYRDGDKLNLLSYLLVVQIDVGPGRNIKFKRIGSNQHEKRGGAVRRPRQFRSFGVHALCTRSPSMIGMLIVNRTLTDLTLFHVTDTRRKNRIQRTGVF